jgi:hypothetical protein
MALVVFSTVLFGQNGVTVIGMIIDRNNAPLVNAYVSIAGVGGYTDVLGRYRLDGVSPELQRMRVEQGQPGPRPNGHIGGCQWSCGAHRPDYSVSLAYRSGSLRLLMSSQSRAVTNKRVNMDNLTVSLGINAWPPSHRIGLLSAA